MIRSFILHTSEIDDPAAAVAQLSAQAAQLPLGAQAIGIVVCHYDFIAEGTVAALERALPFKLIGFTSFYQVTPAASGLFELTITVLTGDDVCFSLACHTGNEEETDQAEKVRRTYERARGQLGCDPAVIFSFFSVRRPMSGDQYLRYLDRYSGGVPVFGAVATGDQETGEDIYVLCDGEIIAYGFAMLLIGGKIQAGFRMGNFRMDRLMEMTATVTAADGERVLELNDQPAAAYLRKHGFPLPDSEREQVSNIPFLSRAPGEDQAIARTLCGFDSDEALRFFGEIPQGSLLRISTLSNEDLIEMSTQTMADALAAHTDAGAVLAFSCVGRYITQGLDPTMEMAHATGKIPAGTPYLACYVGGEICPVSIGGTWTNRYHNSSFVICTLS